MRLFECVPNISEGRRGDDIDALWDAVAVPDVVLLDRSSDPDHNRSVFTLAGTEAALLEALLELFAVAIPRFDLARHRGVHPRIGIVDVVPFIPLVGSSLAEAAALARRLGREVAARYSLPVFLYGAASARSFRNHLAAIRRGGPEGLAGRFADSRWQPDFGAPFLHPTAGATAIGARDFLVAYNVVLATSDVGVARRIAARIRESSGGLPALKAIGVPLPSRGLVQVSMNLVDYRRTSPFTAYRRVCQEAARDDVEVLASEIIGLVPRAALADGSVAELRLESFAPDQILEERLAAAGLSIS